MALCQKQAEVGRRVACGKLISAIEGIVNY